MWKSEFRQNYYRTSFPPTVPLFAARISRVIADGGTWRLKWKRLKAGESNGKLPARTCPGCSVPEPYWSHDWALIPAKPGLQGWILMNECIHKSATTDHNTTCDNALFTLWVTNEGHEETMKQLKQQHSCTLKVKSHKWQMIFLIKYI